MKKPISYPHINFSQPIHKQLNQTTTIVETYTTLFVRADKYFITDADRAFNNKTATNPPNIDNPNWGC